MKVYQLFGYFEKGFWNYTITLEVREDRLIILPAWLPYLLRLGKPFLDLSREEMVGAKVVRYRNWLPIPAIEIRYRKASEERAFVIGFLWQRRRLIQAFRSLGILIQDQRA